MKKNLKISVMLILLSVLFLGCSRSGDESGGGDVGNNGEYYIRMSVDGVAKSGIASTSYLNNYTAQVDNQTQNLKQLIIVNGGFGGNAYETISINNFTGVTSYSLQGDNTWTVAQYGKNANEVYAKESGTVTVTAFTDKTVKGTFEFVGRTYDTNKTVIISKGEFYLPVTKK